MRVKASVRNIPAAPRKTRLVIDMIRNQPVDKAVSILKFSPRKPAKMVLKLLETAVANAVHNYELDKNNLFVKSVQAQEGLTLKRWTPRAHGRATQILKKKSHVFIELDEIKEGKEKKGKKSKMQVVTYKELQKTLKEAKKTVKAAKKKPEKKPSTQIEKKIDSRPRFSRLGDKFKSVLKKRDKKV